MNDHEIRILHAVKNCILNILDTASSYVSLAISLDISADTETVSYHLPQRDIIIFIGFQNCSQSVS